MRARPGVNPQSPGPHIRQPDPMSPPADHRATGRSRLPPARPPPRVLRFTTTANAHLNLGNHSSLPHPFHGEDIDDRPHIIQAVAFTQLHAQLSKSQITCSSSDTSTVPFRQFDVHRHLLQLDTNTAPFRQFNAHGTLAPAPTQPQSPSGNSTFTDHLLQLRHNHNPLETMQCSAPTQQQSP